MFYGEIDIVTSSGALKARAETLTLSREPGCEALDNFRTAWRGDPPPPAGRKSWKGGETEVGRGAIEKKTHGGARHDVVVMASSINRMLAGSSARNASMSSRGVIVPVGLLGLTM